MQPDLEETVEDQGPFVMENRTLRPHRIVDRWAMRAAEPCSSPDIVDQIQKGPAHMAGS